MKKPFIIIISALVSIILSSLAAKDLSKFYLRTYVTNDDYHLLDSLEVSIMKNDTVAVPFRVLSTVKGCGPDVTNGEVRLLVESGYGNYKLFLTKDGYTPAVKEFKVNAAGDDLKYVDMIIMHKEAERNLSAVTVTSTRLKMVMKGDTIVFDAAAFNLPEGSMLDALVRQLPGASIDENGVITVNGRKMNELLINGKDFFKGDPKVALQNLPAYTVKNIQVYDKAADDAYLTKSNVKLTRTEDEENMVIDVTLKKEYNAGWMGNAEGGYGTKERYRGRLFAMGYTEKLRISVFGNANNVGDTETASSDGRWVQTGVNKGVTNRQSGGIDYTYDDSKRVRVTGNLTASHSDQTVHEILSTTGIFPTGNTYSRAINLRNDRLSNLSTTHTLRYSGESFFFSATPSLKWNVANFTENNRQANFTANPQEASRGEAIETLFANRFEGVFSQNLLTALQTLRNHHDTGLNAQFTSSASIRPKSWKGMLSLSAGGTYRTTPSREATLYLQEIGPKGDPAADPLDRLNFSPTAKKNSAVDASIGYTHQWRRFNDVRVNSANLSLNATYNFQQGRDTINYYMRNATGDMAVLPSLQLATGMTLVNENSHFDRSITNMFMQSVGLSLGSEPAAPGDSTFNPAFHLNLSANIREQHDRLRYEKPSLFRQQVNRPTTMGGGMAQLMMFSSNKVRYMTFVLSHQITMTSPSMLYLVNTVDDSDPFNIAYGNPNGLSNAITHRTTLQFSRFARGRHPLNIYWDIHYNSTNNAIALARSYNPTTGVATTYPTNVHGNWNVDSYLQIIPTFGSRNQWQFYTVVYGEYHHDVDYLGLETTPAPSVIRTSHLHNNIRLTYQINKLGSVAFNTTNGFTHMRYPNGRQTPHNHVFGLSTTLNLPLSFEFNTDFNVNMARGLTDSSMNVDQWIWNASVAKYFLKGRLGTRLSAYDILNSARPVSTSATAQSIVERWTNTLPRYIMLTLSYRLEIKPSKSTHTGPSRY